VRVKPHLLSKEPSSWSFSNRKKVVHVHIMLAVFHCYFASLVNTQQWAWPISAGMHGVTSRKYRLEVVEYISTGRQIGTGEIGIRMTSLPLRLPNHQCLAIAFPQILSCLLRHISERDGQQKKERNC